MMRLFKPAVSVALLALLWHLIDPNATWAALSNLDLAHVVIALLLFVASLLIATAKWKSCMDGARFRTLLRSNLASLFYYLLPTGTLGAELSKLGIARSESIPVAKVAGAIAFDKMTSLAALAMIGAVASLFSTSLPSATPWFLSAAALAAMSCLMLAHPMRACLARFPSSRVVRALDSLAQGIAALHASRETLALNLAIGLVAQGLVVFIYLTIANGIGIAAPMADFVACVVLANLAAVLPITLAGIGVREAGLVALLGTAGVDPDSAAALTLCVFGIFLTGSIAGFVAQALPAPKPQHQPKA